MDGETPIRSIAGRAKILPRDVWKSPYRRASPAVDALDCRSRLDEGPARVSNGLGIDREGQLLRFVDILRAEQVRASIVAEGDKTGFRRWRGPGLLFAAVIVAMGAAAAFLQALEPPHGHLNVQPQPNLVPAQLSHRDLPRRIEQPQPPDGVVGLPTDTTASLAPIRPAEPEPLSLSHPYLPEPVLAEQQSAASPDVAEVTTTPPPVVATQPKSIDLLAPRHEADSLASPPPTRMAAEASESETAKPVLWAYYPRGSSRAEASARSLSARIGSNLTNSDFEAQTNLPNDAVIKFSEERNHALARMIGKSLGASGYKWKIENTSSSVGPHCNMVEVWLPR